jgi:hypothetical protein
MKSSTKWALGLVTSITVTSAFVGCGGSGGGTVVVPPGGGGVVINYPYETVYGDVCATFEPSPGCTFDARTGQRITVSADPNYDRYGFGSDDLRFVRFFSDGTADVYSDLGTYLYTTSTSSFAGWISGNVIGVGTTGLFWENVSGGTYWLGKNGVLYNGNLGESNFGEAINNQNAGQASDASAAALASDSNKRLISKAADKLVKDYGLSKAKATAIATSLNVYGVSAATRGYTTTRQIDKTFKDVFGVKYSEALVAVQSLQSGDTSGMRDLTDRSATALGLKPHQAQKFIKGMYKKALASYGIDANMINW